MLQRSTERSGPAACATRMFLCLAAGLVVTNPACDSVQVVIDPPGASGGDGAPQPLPGAMVTVRLANLTAMAVDAEIFVSTNALDSTSETLFVEDNRFTAGIGLAGTGLLAPESTDVAQIACSEGMVIGTAGGLFQDPETGVELGSGTARILQQGLVFDCNAQITFVYRFEGGVYGVHLTLE